MSLKQDELAGSKTAAAPRDASVRLDDPLFAVVELLFFAYRDFTSDPDEILKEYGFGRAHHRVLHFVNRNPGMPVADLLGILKITKQSLGRVLRQLVETGYIEQHEGTSDRRQRLLYTTEQGRALAIRLAQPQIARIARALRDAGARAGTDSEENAREFLYSLIDRDERKEVRNLISKS